MDAVPSTVSGLVAAGLTALLCAPSAAAATPDAGAEENRKGAADGPGASLEQSFMAPDEPRAGDPIELRLTVDHPAGTEVRPEPKLEDSRWNLLERESRTVGGEQRSTTRLTMTFQVFRVGPATLEPIEIVVENDDGEISRRRTDPESIRIHTALEKDAPWELRPATPPHAVWRSDSTIAWIGGGAVAALALGWAAVTLFRRGDKRRPEPAPSKPPETEALERLDALRQSDLLERGDFMVFYVRLSETVRRYLGRRFGFPGTEWTTAEIVERLEEVVWRGDIELEQIAEWMRGVDLVKYSGQLPASESARRRLEEAYEIVRETEPPRAASASPSDDEDGDPEDRPDAEKDRDEAEETR